MKNIAIITYDKPHRKTQDLITKLILNGYNDLHLVIIPWIERKQFNPIFKHRPSKVVDVDIETMCNRLNTSFSKVGVNGLNKFFYVNNFDNILIGGAGILPESLVKNHRIINSHPGYLPNTKGLDSFKWSIYDGQPIGVTTHYISKEIDEGLLIEKSIVPVYFEDTFHGVAYRVYETEIDMLVNSIDKKESLEYLKDDNYKSNKRMSHYKEMIMMHRFEKIRNESKSRL